ncbi:hypothetical protein LCGC14_1680750 [marine sediment metagenome]|uniref:Uncharacterized protein n=1 Tax=marine sediment metagenome TaxID=412755 RepID=A0A0F9HP43_9ZZZZ
MAYETILYGPDSEVFNTYAVNDPAPPAGFLGGPIAYRHRHALGKQLVLEDGRKFRFAAAGGSTLTVGNVLSAGVATASQQSLAPQTAAAVGDNFLILTTGASSAVNVFAEGYALPSITGAAVTGNIYKIGGHALMTSGTDTVFLAPGQTVKQALTTAISKVDLIDNPYFRVIQLPLTTAASMIVGVAVTGPTTLKSHWIQTRGVAAVLGLTGTIAGTRSVAPSGTAGACIPETPTEATSKLQSDIGFSIHAHAATEGQPTFLTIDG